LDRGFQIYSNRSFGNKTFIGKPFLTFFVYKVMSIQAVSNLIGAIEIIIAVLLVFSVKFAVLRRYAGIGMTITFW
jgi:uncharacterized membrane protein YkgB